MTTRDKLAQGIMAFKSRSDLLEKEASDLRERLELFEKRAQAEEILLLARNTTAPEGLRAATIEDFLAKRAQLENASDGHIEKVAMFVQYLDESGGLSLSEETDHTGRGDFNEWLASIA